MQFPLIHTGRRFFFLTFAAEGRPPVLSRLERGAKRPILLPPGERVVALWRRLHEIEPCFTASDFVVMPDHVHLLLIVNSQGEFRFNPLVFAHWFQRTTEGAAPRTPCAPQDWWHYYDRRGTPYDRRGTPPNPRLESGQGFGGGEPLVGAQPLQGFGGGEPLGGAQPLQGFGGGEPPSFVWERNFWVDISFDSRQLSAIRRYIKMNPVRYFWKLDNPDMFRFRPNVRHPALDPALAWSAVGDLTILASPFLYLVRLTMKKSAAELEDEIVAHVERARSGWTPVCGFISPGEREFERRLKALPHSRWIKTVPYGLPERYDPSVEDSRWLAAHRQLVLSSFVREDIPPFHITRAGCLAMNDRIAAMVVRAQGGG